VSTFEKDRKVVDLATKATLAFRILRITQRDLNTITSEVGWEASFKEYQAGKGEDPQIIRRVRIKAYDAADTEFWDAILELNKEIG